MVQNVKSILVDSFATNSSQFTECQLYGHCLTVLEFFVIRRNVRLLGLYRVTDAQVSFAAIGWIRT